MYKYIYIYHKCLITFKLFYALNITVDVRLTDGQAGNQGRVEVRRHVDERWGKVCDMNFGGNEAAAVCRQLNYKYDFFVNI
jgi:hypothetical protein